MVNPIVTHPQNRGYHIHFELFPSFNSCAMSRVHALNLPTAGCQRPNLAMALQQEKDILSQVGAFPQPTETRNGEMTNGYPHHRPIHRAIPSLRNVYQSNILFCEIVWFQPPLNSLDIAWKYGGYHHAMLRFYLQQRSKRQKNTCESWKFQKWSGPPNSLGLYQPIGFLVQWLRIPVQSSSHLVYGK